MDAAGGGILFIESGVDITNPDTLTPELFKGVTQASRKDLTTCHGVYLAGDPFVAHTGLRAVAAVTHCRCPAVTPPLPVAHLRCRW